MFRLVVYLFFALFQLKIVAQTTLLRKYVDEQTERTMQEDKGPGRKYDNSAFVLIGVNHTLPKLDYFKSDISTIVHQSAALGFGLYRQVKLHKYFSLGFSSGYLFKNITVCKLQKISIWDSSLGNYNKEKYTFHQFFFEPNLRIHLNKPRGDYLGKFIDFGASVNVSFLNNQRLSVVNDWNIRSETLINRYPNFIKRFEYQVVLRYGFNDYSFFVNYRLNNLVNKDTPSEYKDLASFTTGFKLNF